MAPDSRLFITYPSSSTSFPTDLHPKVTPFPPSSSCCHSISLSTTNPSNPSFSPATFYSLSSTTQNITSLPLAKCSYLHPSTTSLAQSSTSKITVERRRKESIVASSSISYLSTQSERKNEELRNRRISYNLHHSSSLTPRIPQSLSNHPSSTHCQCYHQHMTTSTSSSALLTNPPEASSTSTNTRTSIQFRTPRSRTCSFFFSHRWALLSLVLALCLPKEVRCGQHERRLLHDLLDNYNPLERPVANESDPVLVSFGITLQQIIDVDEKNQLLITNTWLKLEWNDVNLRWNESDYGGVKDLRIPPYKIWKPDVLMYNSADEGFDGTYQTKVVVSSDGSCLYIPPGIFKSTCKIDITWFPFDDQRCKMKFGSWTYSGWQLDLQLQSEEGGDLSDFIKNGEWDLIGCPGKRNAIYYQCCPEPYVDVTFEIVIRRRTLYYFCNLILPCVLIASMAVLGFTLPPDCGEKLSLGLPGERNLIHYSCCPEPYVDITFFVIIRRRTIYYLHNLVLPCVLISSMSMLGFTLPPESGEKLTLGVTILLSLTVFTSMVNDSIPSTSDAVPLLGKKYKENSDIIKS
ncbi:UNVERIFIED_CONTAM: hypothetical protein RMT77_008709 [Armadillidium vulgare]